jgi:hypothetical protein
MLKSILKIKNIFKGKRKETWAERQMKGMAKLGGKLILM